ncbi:transposase [Streptomyces sp. HSG2]|uniref:transposase n=1 Tax=Streptomyces sp. HSG2 TaxID=2797167 RepID=UPI001905AD61|nr:transposase [Streptomyces sp. HSG2]
MSGKSNMSKRYTAEFKRDAISLVRSSPHRNVTEIARELGVSPQGLRGWVKQARIDRGEGPTGALTSDERDELRRLCRELAEVRKANACVPQLSGVLGGAAGHRCRSDGCV